nr:patatin-like phospholipase family protein [Roseimicrobium gellanilyticum]
MLSAPSIGPKRILSIEGGGVRGVFSLRILLRMEELLRRKHGKDSMVLADHFHLISGTSVGAIIGTYLSYGWPVGEMLKLFKESLPIIFARAQWWKLHGAAYRRGPLREMLQKHFVEPNGGQALFGTRRLKTWLLVVLRNMSTGAAWPLLNHPEGKFAKLQEDGSSNLKIPLWQVVRASTAAPWFFPPERVTVAAGQTMEFVDGGITPHNNPSVISYLMATLPCFPLQWKKGVNNIQVVSVGTGRIRAKLGAFERGRLGRLRFLDHVPAALIESTSLAQDLTMRSWGRCIQGGVLDSELGHLSGKEAVGSDFLYCRYNTEWTTDEIDRACAVSGCKFALSSVKLAPWLESEGEKYADKHVRIEHFP